MKKNIRKFLYSTTALVAVAFSTIAVAGSVSDMADKDAQDKLPDWLKRIEVEGNFAADGKPAYSVMTVQPISDEENSVIFNQSRVAYSTDGRTTANIGLGYRQLTNNQKIMLGVNAFYDHQFPYGHQRSSYGAEVKSSAFELNGNYYVANSGWRDADTIFEERALDGHDVEIGAQLPYLPWAWGFVQNFYYDGKAGDDLEGMKYSLRLRPFKNIEFEGGHTSTDETSDNNFVMARYRIGFNEPKYVSNVRKSGWVSSRAFETGESMADRKLEKVRRSNEITVERRVKSSAGGTGARASVILARGS